MSVACLCHCRTAALTLPPLAFSGWTRTKRRSRDGLALVSDHRVGHQASLSPPDRQVDGVRGCLVGWDYVATGIWMIPGKANACLPALRGLLSPALHEDLKRWNRVVGARRPRSHRARWSLHLRPPDCTHRALGALGNGWAEALRRRRRQRLGGKERRDSAIHLASRTPCARRSHCPYDCRCNPHGDPLTCDRGVRTSLRRRSAIGRRSSRVTLRLRLADGRVVTGELRLGR